MASGWKRVSTCLWGRTRTWCPHKAIWESEAHSPPPQARTIGFKTQTFQRLLELTELREDRGQYMLSNNFFWENYNFVLLAQDTPILPDV